MHRFCTGACTDGTYPDAGLIQAADGNLYGTAAYGGGGICTQRPIHHSGCGTIFKITLGGKLTTLHHFDSTGFWPGGALVQATDANFYGTTEYGGASDYGTIFMFTPEGTLTTLHSFDYYTDGAWPPGGLLQATDGTFYGVTEGGSGTLFSLDMGLGPFVSFVHNPAKVGGSFGVLGQGLTGTTGVSLNGTLATFTVKSDTLILATVPAGATTGYVTVTTPSGTLTSNVPFHVMP